MAFARRGTDNHHSRIATTFLAGLLTCLLSWGDLVGEYAADSHAQEFVPGQRPTPEQIERFRERFGGRRGRRGPQPPPTEEPKPEEKKEGEEKPKEEEKSEEEGIKTIKRPTDGSAKLDPNRVRLKPDENGLVQFNYNGHPWSAVLQEYADAAKLSFDWQELPADNLNLVTQRKYNLDQARDLLNRHLLARGFTLVMQGEVLSAVKIEKLDPSLVPKVEADDLEDFPPHDFVRVRYQLPISMDPSKAAEDVKILLSPNAKVTPLLATKRLLVIDNVGNQRSVRDLIYSEQISANSEKTPQIYQIRHRRADYIADQVMIVLGMDPEGRKSGDEMRLERERLRLFSQMQQRGTDVAPMLKKDEPPVHIAVDMKQNRLFVNAPPQYMPVIHRTILELDVADGSQPIASMGERVMRRYKTATNPDSVVNALLEMGTLEPLTQLQSDSNAKVIFATATEADHAKIKGLIGELDGSGRQMKVIQLRRYGASQVAGTLTMILGDLKAEEQDNNNGRRGRRNPFFFMQQQEEPEVGFKALPDVENNRLLLWANADELEQVNLLLEEIGESSDAETRDQSKLRVLGSRTPEETAALLEKLKAAYPGKLNIQMPEPKPEEEKPKEDAESLLDKVTEQARPRSKFWLTQTQVPAGEVAPADLPAVANEPAPEVNIVVTEDGRLVVSSDDPNAINQLEDLMRVIEPPQQEFEFFKLTYVYADEVVENLENYFSEDLKGQTETVYDEWGQYSGRKEKETEPASLGRRQLLRFIDDFRTNTVIVQGASPAQLAIIKQLIELYDRAPKQKDYYARNTRIIKLTYSRAADIQKSIKEVYRELLSSKDVEFQGEDGRSTITSSKRPYVFGEVRSDDNGVESPVLISFDGVLSIGVDEVSNSVIVSAREEVLESIERTVKALDVAAKPDTMIHVHRVGGTLSAAGMQQMLAQSLGQPWPGGKPLAASSQNQGGNNRGNNNRNNRNRRDRGNRGRRGN